MYLIERWIRDGGRDPRELSDVSTSIKPRGEEVSSAEDDNQR
jgi:hypothetical protein